MDDAATLIEADIDAGQVSDGEVTPARSVTDASRTRSAVSNGSRLFAVPVGQSKPARRYRDLLHALTAEYGAVGEADLSLCRRAAGLSLTLEEQEAAMVSGQPVDAVLFSTLTNSLRRLLADLGASQRRRRRGRAP